MNDDYKNILNDSLDPVLVYGPNGYLIYTNPAFVILTGFDKVVGTAPPFPWWTDDLELYSLAFKIAITKGSRHRSIKFRNFLNKHFYVDIVTSKLNCNGQSVQNWFDVTDEILQRQEIETLLSRYNGRSVDETG